MSVSVKVDMSKLLAALARAPKEVTRELRIGQGKAMGPVQRRARAFHRFKPQSGAAEDSIIAPQIESSGLSSKIELDDGIASYSRYLHEGFKSWAPDPFLYNALEHQKEQIISTLEEALSKAFAKAGF